MKEISTNENIKLINEDENEKKEILIKKENKPNSKYNYFFSKQNSNHKFVSSFKLRLLKGIDYLDEHLNFYSFIKFIFGLIFLELPLILIIFIVYSDIPEKNKYIFFPYFISVSLIIGSLLIFSMIKLANSCKMFGIFIESYERISIFKIMKFILAELFLLWFLFISENFVLNFNLMKEKVTQSKTKENTSKLFNEGTYTMRLLFIFLFWDLEKNNDEYVYKKLGYFEYEDNFFDDFQEILSKLLIPIIAFCFCGIFKIIFIKTKRGLIYSILYLITIFISFYILFYDISKDREDIKYDEEQEYFKDTNIKYLEIIPITFIILILLLLNTKIYIINLRHKKYYSYANKSKNNFVNFLIIFSYILNSAGYILILYVLYYLFLNKITPEFSIEEFNKFWMLIYISLLLIFFGYAFPFGHYYFNLLFHSTAFESFDHFLKNNFYTNSSGTIKKSSTLFQKRISNKSF